MMNFKKITLNLAAIFVLSACAADYQPDYGKTRNVIDATSREMTLYYRNNSKTPLDIEPNELKSFLKNSNPEIVKEVEILQPTSISSKYGLKASSIISSRYGWLSNYLSKNGIDKSKITFKYLDEVDSKNPSQDIIILRIGYVAVTAPDCRNLQYQTFDILMGTSSRDYGCVTRSNLGKMIDDPVDMLHGNSGYINADPERGGLAIRTFREQGQGSTSETSTSGSAAAAAPTQ